MVDFDGWEAPVSYGSQIEEHHALRRHAGMFDASPMRTANIEGAGSRYVQRHRVFDSVNNLGLGLARLL